MFCLVLSLQQVHQVQQLCAGRTESLATVLQPPFRWSPPAVHVLPMPPHLQAIGLVPLDDKSASGNAVPFCVQVACPSSTSALPLSASVQAVWAPRSCPPGTSFLPIDSHVLPIYCLCSPTASALAILIKTVICMGC